MESVGKTPECVEQEFGEVLASRNAAIKNLDDIPGIGPPDICWIQRTAKSLFGTRNPKLQGYYHWVVGLSITSGACVAAYFARLAATAKKVGYYQGMGVGREITIGRAIYCCYDPFSNMDIWVEMAMPGGAVCRAVDREGYLHDVTSEMWKGAHLASFLRFMLYDSSVTLHCSRAFQHLSFFKTLEDETELLKTVRELYQADRLQSVLPRIHWDKGQGTEPYHMDPVCNSILEHFKARRRWQRGLQFFTELQTCYPSCVVHLAEIYRALDNDEGAGDLLKSALHDLNKQKHPMLVLACGYVYLQNNRRKKAAQIAQSVLDNDSQIRPAWFLMARALTCQGLYDKCLRTLHWMPAPLIPADRSAQLLRVPPPTPKSVTKGSSNYNPEEAEISTVVQESQRPGLQMALVPGQVLAPRVQLHSTDWGLFSCIQCVMRAVYDVLLDIVHNVGWTKFCEIRSSVFVLPSTGFFSHRFIPLEALLGEEDSIAGEADDWQPIELEFIVHGDPSHLTKAVTIAVINKDNAPEQKPRRKTSFYARSISIGTPNAKTESDTALLESSISADLANSVLSRGLGQITKKSLHRPPSSISTVIHDDSEPTDTPRTRSEHSMTPSTIRAPIDTERVEFGNLGTPAPSPMKTPTASSGGVVEEPLHSEKMNGKRRIIEETVVTTTTQQLPIGDEVPDAPENTLPYCTSFTSDHHVHGPLSTSTSFSQDRWQVKMVSMGIQERVRYFDQMAKDKIAKQSPGLDSPAVLEHECLVNTRPKRSRRMISQTIAERLIREATFPDLAAETVPSLQGDPIEETEIDSDAPPMVTDWGSFALDDADHVPRTSSRPQTRLSLFDGFGSGPVFTDAKDGISEKLDESDEPCVCAEWLDELILALWEDLAIYMKFKSFDRRLRSKNMQTHAESILGTIEWNADTTDDDDHLLRTPTAGPTLPESRPVDWMSRGLLCERLRKVADAEQAYRVCVFQTFNMTSLLALSRIYAVWGYSKGTALLLNRLAQFHHKKRHTSKELYLPLSFVTRLSCLLESIGNKDLKAAAENSHELVCRAVEDVLKWRLR